MVRQMLAAALLFSVADLIAQTVVDVTGIGREKIPVQINVADQTFANTLKKNLELSGVFIVKKTGSIKVAGASGALSVTGNGKVLSSSDVFSDAKSARMAARRLSDSMCKSFANQKGFACNRIAFVSKKDKNSSELCVCYPDGYDIRQLTGNGKTVVGPRWKDSNTIFYTGIVNAGPQIWEYDCASSRRNLRWSFKGLTTGACVSPDGVKAAVILSFQGNPELYVIDMPSGKWVRMTNTPLASEGQPAWSPDGRKIVYVSDETRHPQLYVIDVATKAKRRLTSKGSQNVDPDWGSDGRIAYITKRGGAQVAVMNPELGESSVKLVTGAGNWEHPSWSCDSRNLVASRDRALFVVDTEMQGDTPEKPKQIFFAQGSWITPSWSR